MEDRKRDLLRRGERLKEKLNCGSAFVPVGRTDEGEGAGTKRQGGTKHEACDLIRDIVM